MADKRRQIRTKSERVTVRMDRATRHQIKTMAAAARRSESDWIRIVLLRAVEAA